VSLPPPDRVHGRPPETPSHGAGEAAPPGLPPGGAEPKLVTKVRERRADFKSRGRLYRAAFVVVGFVLVLGGMAMLVLPGPAFVVIPIGLAILSLQFAWAESLLDRSLVEADKAKRKAQQTTRRQRILSGLAAACAAAAFVVLAILYDIPLVPWCRGRAAAVASARDGRRAAHDQAIDADEVLAGARDRDLHGVGPSDLERRAADDARYSGASAVRTFALAPSTVTTWPAALRLRLYET
jgi:uncharacterized protein (TIGR02611 family)